MPGIDDSQRQPIPTEYLDVAMESLVEEAWRVLEGVYSPGRPWPAVLRDGAAALLELLSERPGLAHVALVDAPLAGGRGGTLHASAKAAVLDFLERGRPLAARGVPASAARGALAGAEAAAVRHVLAGKAAQLTELTPDVIYMLAVPFLGVGEAAQLARQPRRRGRLRAVA